MTKRGHRIPESFLKEIRDLTDAQFTVARIKYRLHGQKVAMEYVEKCRKKEASQ